MFRIADSHSDFPGFMTPGAVTAHLYNHGSLDDMEQGGVKLQVFAAWVPQQCSDRLRLGLNQIDYMRRLIDGSKGKIILADSKNAFSYDRPLKAVLAVESCETIDFDVSAIEKVYGMGVRVISLTWNDENEFAYGCYRKGGLKPKGVKAVREINRLHMALDFSHINEDGFWEASKIYDYPPCATHSCAYEIHPNSRNLKREQAEYLIKSGGYIGITFYTEFLKGNNASIDDIIEHMEYFLSLGAEDSLGFGSDFFGMPKAPKGLESPALFQRLPDAMQKRNYKDELIKKICYGNFEKYILKFL